ncbi:MAG: DNA primase [Planctomycetes bacterium]|nr:DNA primase [Planctomycetota bacterium]MBI3844610.1 DNA primase [Planctomycetota bacterium]
MQKKLGQFIPEDTLSQVRSANDVVELIGSYVPLKRSGSSWKGLCPFHEEKTPSFSVNPQRQTYHCFGCGASGNAISFVMAVEKLTFVDAVRSLADRAGIRIQPQGPREAAEASRRAAISSTVEWATKYFEETLWSSAGVDARKYLLSRGIAATTARTYRLGFALPSWDGLLRAARGFGISQDLLAGAGLVIPRENGGCYDRFRARLVFPIFDVQGRPIAFGARSLDGSEPKYLNSPETELFSKGRVLYGLHVAGEAARKGSLLAIGEGYTDVIMAHQLGFAPMVATLGTALTRDHARLVRRFAEDVRLVYDADEGGERASERGIEIFLEEGLEVRIATLPDGLDPCDLLVRDGSADSFRAAIDGARDYVEYAIDAAQKRHDTTTVSGRAAAAESLLEIVRRLGDPIRRDLVVRRISDALGVSETALRQKLAEKSSKTAPRPASQESDGPVESPRRRWESELVAQLFAMPTRLPSVAAELTAEGLEEKDLSSVLESALAIARSGETPTADRLLLALEDDGARRLAASLLAHEWLPGTEEKQFDGAVGALRQRQKKMRLERLRASRLEAASRGDLSAVEGWLRETESELRRR